MEGVETVSTDKACPAGEIWQKAVSASELRLSRRLGTPRKTIRTVNVADEVAATLMPENLVEVQVSGVIQPIYMRSGLRSFQKKNTSRN